MYANPLQTSLFRRILVPAAAAIVLITAANIAANPAIAGRLISVSLLGTLLAVGIAYVVTRSVDRRLQRMQHFTLTLLENSSGDAPNAFNDELDNLERSLIHQSLQVRKLLQKLTSESKQREAILASMGEAVVAVDHQMRITFCNPAFARLAQIRPPLERVFLLEALRDTTFAELLKGVIRDGAPVTCHLHVPATKRTFEVQVVPQQCADKPGAIAILHDISDLERLEHVRTDFVANVSHEFRTPLAAIAGYAETLLDGAIDDEENRRRFIEIIRNNALRLNSIAADLLTLSELQRANSSTSADTTSIVGALEAALLTVQSEAADRGVRITRGSMADASVQGSRFRLEQAFVNLLANAVKFNRDGGEVRVEAHNGSGDEARIIISDTGVGIPSSDLPRIFERFYRVDRARSRQVGGTGLGLSIVKHIVEGMDGRVLVESQFGKGSVFTVVLPCLTECRTVTPSRTATRL